jgi:S1-C subfamily serine protease
MAATASSGGEASAGRPVQGVSTSGAAQELQQQYQSVVKAVLPSVVEIAAGDATGSGVVYDGKGDIVTNAHVVGNATTVEVGTAEGGSRQGQMMQAKVVGTFAADDLAVVRVSSGAGSLHPATFGPSGSAATGQIVLAMGSPLGLSGSVTQGIISAVGRTVSEGGTAPGATPTTIINALQTSADINGGNSGGALVNLSGQVIGIPAAAAQNPSSGNQAAGIGFAIPSATVTNIAGQLIKTGKVSNSGRASLGVSAHNATSSGGQPGGVAVVSVVPGGAADKAGIKAGDVITAVGGQQVPDTTTLTAVLATVKPGMKVPVQYSRDGGTAEATVTLGNLEG